jgi:hypothetical protein
VLSIILPSCSPDATGLRFAPSGLRGQLTAAANAAPAA